MVGEASTRYNGQLTMGYSRREFLVTLSSVAVPSALQRASAQPARKPNIIFILADDLGYGDVGCYGQKQILTPNIDRLASEGMKFTQAYAGSTVCAPSRCALMTGKHMGHATIRGNKRPETPLRPEDITVAEILKRAGYVTGCFGKWGMGTGCSPGIPTRQGFDEWFGYLDQLHAHNFYPEWLWENELEVPLRGNMGGLKQEYSHDLFTERALNFIERNAHKPFFLYLAYTVPHANNELGRVTGNGMEVPDYGPYKDKPWPDQEKGFAAMIYRMDRDIGRLLDLLKKLKIDDNTLIFFSSDNGPHAEGGHNPDFFDSNGPLRGIKRDLYEGGIRVPTIVRWPGKVTPGTVSNQVWAFWDFLPTVAELVGVNPPEGIDGISILPTLLGTTGQKQHEYLYWEFHERGFSQAVRMGKWKAVRNGCRQAPIELYDLEEDISESRNLADQFPKIVRQMAEIMEEARVDSPDFPIREKC